MEKSTSTGAASAGLKVTASKARLQNVVRILVCVGKLAGAEYSVVGPSRKDLYHLESKFGDEEQQRCLEPASRNAANQWKAFGGYVKPAHRAKTGHMRAHERGRGTRSLTLAVSGCTRINRITAGLHVCSFDALK